MKSPAGRVSAIAIVAGLGIAGYLVTKQPNDPGSDSGTRDMPVAQAGPSHAVVIESIQYAESLKTGSEPLESKPSYSTPASSPQEETIDLGPDLEAEPQFAYISTPGKQVENLGPDIDPEPVGTYSASTDNVAVRDLGEDIDADNWNYVSSNDEVRDIGDDMDPDGYGSKPIGDSPEIRDIGEDIDAD